ncbi:hypothetical protein MtrunA17_Chr8g0390161 [Medicago truncatula]|uniref:Uncharacterized protein n=1 Tax=Medicago truncatula TaxID=3880 RepID=A0A396GYB5_MEDTR|nr:hypothetical protein MtrunA17_Chr8g0390161 [Medicago truncatula]
MWLERNNVIFNRKVANYLEVVDHIKSLSWSWFMCREGGIEHKLSMVRLVVESTCLYPWYMIVDCF